MRRMGSGSSSSHRNRNPEGGKDEQKRKTKAFVGDAPACSVLSSFRAQGTPTPQLRPPVHRWMKSGLPLGKSCGSREKNLPASSKSHWMPPKGQEHLMGHSSLVSCILFSDFEVAGSEQKAEADLVGSRSVVIKQQPTDQILFGRLCLRNENRYPHLKEDFWLKV